VEVLRPGLAIVDAGAALRYHGEKALEMLVDASSYAGFDSTLGVADEIATAVIAARHRGMGAVVPEGGSREFLATQPIEVLAADEALGFDAGFVAQLDKKSGRATKVDGAVGSSAIAEQDLSTQLSGWMAVEAAARLVRMGCSFGY